MKVLDCQYTVHVTGLLGPMNRILTSIVGFYSTGLLAIVVALSSGTGLSWSCDWDSQVLKVIVVALNSGTGLSWSCDWDSQVLKVIVDNIIGDQLLGH